MVDLSPEAQAAVDLAGKQLGYEHPIEAFAIERDRARRGWRVVVIGDGKVAAFTPGVDVAQTVAYNEVFIADADVIEHPQNPVAQPVDGPTVTGTTITTDTGAK